MLTGHGSAESALKAIHRGSVFRYLQKPCHPMDLMACIRQGLLIQALTDNKWRMPAAEQEALLNNLRDDSDNRQIADMLQPVITLSDELVAANADGSIIDSAQHYEQTIGEHLQRQKPADATQSANECADFLKQDRCHIQAAKAKVCLAMVYYKTRNMLQASRMYKESLDLFDTLET